MNSQHIQRSVNAVKWAIVDRAGSQVILLVNTIVLARLLNPKDFGLISMLYIFMSISSAFVDSGMAGGLIRKQTLTNVDCSTLFYFNVAVGVFFYILLFFSAPYVSIFYGQPLTALLRVLSLNIIFNSLALIHKTLLVKDLKLKLVTRSSLIGSVISTTIGILCAIRGFGVWSLVILQITQAIISMTLLWRFSHWLPTWSFSKESFKEFYSFGLGLFLSNLLDIFFKNIYQPLIGKFFSPSYAGLYYQARRLYEIPFTTISSVVDSISYPMLVKYQDDFDELSNTYQNIFKLLIYVSLPIVVVLFSLSNEIVLVVLGKKWLLSSDLLRILSLSGLFTILETINRSLLKIEGRTRLIFKLEVVKKAIIVITILSTYKFGIKALMYGIVLNSIISYALNQYFTTIKLNDYNRIFRIMFSALIMGLTIFACKSIINNSLIALITSVMLGFGIFLLLGQLMKIREQKLLVSIINNKFRNEQ